MPVADAFGAVPDRQRRAYDFYLQRGYTPVQAAGIVGGLRGETANFNTDQVHDGGIGLGIAGWNGPRLQALHGFAQSRGSDPRDLDTQLAFVDHELNTSERTAADALRAATTPEAAGNAMLRYFRPSNWNVPGAHPERANYAAQTYGAFNGGAPVAMASTAPTAVPSNGALSSTDIVQLAAAPSGDTTPAPLTLPAIQPQSAPRPEEGVDNVLMDPAFEPRALRQKRTRQLSRIV